MAREVDAAKNRLLTLLPESERQQLVGDGVITSLRLKKQLYGSGDIIDAVYFPLDCVVSVLMGAGEGSQVEMATIGNEGAVGIYSLLSPNAMGTNIVQIAGDALRLEAAAFAKHLNNSACDKLMRRYLYALTFQIIQAGACNRLHTMEKRCARWLLMMHDRSDNDTFPLTQEFVAEMLGVRRATVNMAVGVLKTAGFIQYVRGQIRVVDRVGLESAACPCYMLIRQQYANLAQR